MAFPRFSSGVRTSISHHATFDTHRSQGGTTANKSKDKKHRNVTAEGTSRGKGEIEDTVEVNEDVVSTQFRERRKK